MFEKELKLIKESKLFKPDLYLCSIFIFNNKTQFDFYSKKSKLVTSFIVEDNEVNILNKEEKIFQKEKKDLEELRLEKVKIDLEKALERVGNSVKKHKETTTKQIIILQQNKFPLWNISSITSSFNIINIKINAETGKILEEIKESILNFKRS